ncbi:MAG: pyrroline-5-carboxylate reductase [Verrucomicrobiota bacterium]
MNLEAGKAMRLGVIGCGKMGRALLEGILEKGVAERAAVVVHDAFPEAAAAFGEDLGVAVSRSNREVVEASDVVLLCVKPQGFAEMMGEIEGTAGSLLISIAAGITLTAIETQCQRKHRVIRVMPNTPSLVGRGAAGFALGQDATDADGDLARGLLEAVGYAVEVNEDQLDAVTAISGSGPAYIFLMIESIVTAGVRQGLSADVAQALAVETVAGAAELVKATGESPSQLRENVTSPNGTTFAALESFRNDHFPDVIDRAVAAAADRSRELGRG